jgi:hypothetical protein
MALDSMPTMTTPKTSAGWHVVTDDPTKIQYFDGQDWKGETKPNPTLTPADGYYLIDGAPHLWENGQAQLAKYNTMIDAGVSAENLMPMSGVTFCAACGETVSLTAPSCSDCGAKRNTAVSPDQMANDIRTIKTIMVLFTILWVIGAILLVIGVAG